MINTNALRNAETYIHQQERTVELVPDDELEAFVTGSIGKLAASHIQPMVHAVSETIEPTTSNKLAVFLDLPADCEDMVDLPFSGTLPARFSKTIEENRTDSLLLPMDGTFLKIGAGAGTPYSEKKIAMSVTSYTLVSDDEAAEYRRTRAYIPEGSIIIKPRRTVSYRSLTLFGYKSSVYWFIDDDADKSIIFPGLPESLPSSGEFKTMHQAFMREAQVALVGLRSVLR